MLYGDTGNDWFAAGLTADGTFTLDGSTITAAAGYDVVYGGDGSDTIYLSDGLSGQQSLTVVHDIDNFEDQVSATTVQITAGVLGAGTLLYIGSDPSTAEAVFLIVN